jgi:thiol-disulfide isomerase/thioredoxin
MVRFAVAALALAISAFGTQVLGSEILLLDFWSPSCGPCMQMKPVVKALEDARYPIRQVDTTRDFQLSRQFNVDRIPCFVMLVDGQEIDREIGFTSSERLQQMFEKAKDEVRRRQGFRGQNAPLATANSQSPAPNIAPAAPPANANQPWPANTPTVGVAPQSLATTPTIESQAAPAEALAKLIAATVRLKVEDAEGRSFGTGTIVDARSGEALIVTCGHLFRASKGKGPVTVEFFEAGLNGVRVVGQLPGQVISYDLERDVALISIHADRQVTVAPVAPTRTPIVRGDRVTSIGCSNGQDPTVMETRVMSADGFQPPSIKASGSPVEGRSGGGLFNGKGQLVGVCFGADHEGNAGMYAALESVHGELDRLGLKDIYAKAEAPSAAGPAVVRGQELAPIGPVTNNEPIVRPAATGEIDPGRIDAPSPKGLNATEQAAWEEIMSRASSYEVVVIVRPKEPGGQSEIITLDSVSPAFAKALAERQRSPQAPVTR